ncbi:hypothetical protein GCM10022204_20700 [Microlunatus aurantiacus]|uniref:DUF4352 domain-containing protein n=1 Tax=Microlunatus aurantiacus TaxID=446786 RepID=A0ABP7DDW7_9ACTN
MIPGRRRAWLRAACVLVAVAVYLNVWTTYALYGLTEYGRYTQQQPGASTTAMGAEFRLVSLVQTTELVNSVTEEVASPSVNAVWVVARVDVVRRTEDPNLLCVLEILGPGRRVWEPNRDYVSRDGNSTCTLAEMPLGSTWPLEIVFQVPEKYAGELAGVAVNDPVSRSARPVLVPPR